MLCLRNLNNVKLQTKWLNRVGSMYKYSAQWNSCTILYSLKLNYYAKSSHASQTKSNWSDKINNFYGVSRQVISHVVFVVKAKFGGTFLSLHLQRLENICPNPKHHTYTRGCESCLENNVGFFVLACWKIFAYWGKIEDDFLCKILLYWFHPTQNASIGNISVQKSLQKYRKIDHIHHTKSLDYIEPFQRFNIYR